MVTTTISINQDVKDTAKATEAKKFRGGFSEYVETLIREDFKKKKIELIKKEVSNV